MDIGKRPKKFSAARNTNKLYMDLKDIVREHGLPFLPAKSLFKFQTVCRDWKLQMSTPFFHHTQTVCHRSISGIFLQVPGEPPTFVPFEPESCGVPDPSLKFIPVPVDILASSNGLICCRGRVGDGDYYICNPALQQWKKLPKYSMNHGTEPAVVLIFEPCLLNFDADYQLVCAIRSSDFDDGIEFEIYSSKEGSWKVSAEISFAVKKLVPKSGVSTNGVVYWEAPYEYALLSYDPKIDKSQLLRWYPSRNGKLGIVDGKLCKAHTNGRSLMLTVLEDSHPNTNQTINTDMRYDRGHSIHLASNTLFGKGLLTGDPVLFVGGDIVLVKDLENVYSFNMKTKKSKAICKVLGYDTRCIACVNSLVSL